MLRPTKALEVCRCTGALPACRQVALHAACLASFGVAHQLFVHCRWPVHDCKAGRDQRSLQRAHTNIGCLAAKLGGKLFSFCQFTTVMESCAVMLSLSQSPLEHGSMFIVDTCQSPCRCVSICISSQSMPSKWVNNSQPTFVNSKAHLWVYFSVYAHLKTSLSNNSQPIPVNNQSSLAGILLCI